MKYRIVKRANSNVYQVERFEQGMWLYCGGCSEMTLEAIEKRLADVIKSGIVQDEVIKEVEA